MMERSYKKNSKNKLKRQEPRESGGNGRLREREGEVDEN